MLRTKIVIVSLILLFINGTVHSSKNVAAPVPTILLHGYKGGNWTFNTLVTDFSKRNIAELATTCTLRADGKATCTKWENTTNNPLVKVIYEENQANLTDQTKWLKRILLELNKQNKSNKINIISHSMGGLLATKYILDTAADKAYPKVHKLVTLDSPILGTTYFMKENIVKAPALIDLKPDSAVIHALYEKRAAFPNNVQAYSTAAAEDLVVRRSSAYGLSNYTSRIKTESFQVDHTEIHEEKRVLYSISCFIW